MASRHKIAWVLAAAAVALGFSASGADALDVGAMFNIGNLVFRQDRASTDTGFSGTYFPWGISMFGSEQVSDTMSINAGFYNDPILRNIAYSTINYQGSYFSVGAGPLLGIFNSTGSPLNPGITATVRVQIPGVVYLSYRTDSSLGGTLVQAGDYLQQRSDISLGYYIPNAIASLNILTRKYTEKTSANNETIDQVTEYAYKTDLFQKNTPYRVVLTFGYQTLSKTFVNSGSTPTTVVDQLGSIIVGTRVEFHVLNYLKFIADLKSSVYTFGQKALVGLSNPGPNGYLFQLNTGVELSLDRLLSK